MTDNSLFFVDKKDKTDKIDLSKAYAIGIGEWDKVTVAYSYSQFDSKTNERKALNTIISKANEKGLRFITDTDARAQGGAHALAHLWDNGKSAANELNNVLKVREKAISNFLNFAILKFMLQIFSK